MLDDGRYTTAIIKPLLLFIIQREKQKNKHVEFKKKLFEKWGSIRNIDKTFRAGLCVAQFWCTGTISELILKLINS